MDGGSLAIGVDAGWARAALATCLGALAGAGGGAAASSAIADGFASRPCGAGTATDASPEEGAEPVRAGAGLDTMAAACATACRPSGEVSNPAVTGVAKAQTPTASRRALAGRDRGEDRGAVMIFSTRVFRLEPEAPAIEVTGDCR